MVLLSAAFVAGCKSGTDAPPANFVVASLVADSVFAPVGDLAGAPLRVSVRTEDGQPARGVRVVFAVVAGDEGAARPTLRDTVALSDADGVARVGVRGGSTPGRGIVRAALRDNPARQVEMVVRGVAGSVVTSVTPTTAGGGDTLILRGSGLGTALGAVSVEVGPQSAQVASVSGDSLVRVVMPACLPEGPTTVTLRNGTRRTPAVGLTVANGGTVVTLPALQVQVASDTALARGCLALPADGGRYLLVPQYASAVDGLPNPTRAQVPFVLSAQTTVALVPAGAAAAAMPALLQPPPASDDPAARLHDLLRRTERDLSARLTPPPAYPREPFVAAPPALGSRRSFQVLNNLTGTEFSTVEARLAYVGPHSLIYTDATPPTGVGFTDAEIGTFAPEFDNTLHRLAVETFGPETDIDGNGRVIVLITQAVNKLTPPPACDRFIAGFFYGLDFFPGQRGSNGGEIFYSLTPVASGSTTDCARSRSFIQSLLPATFIHEFQHMISFGQHVLLRGGQSEDVWLNEGLSHIAEETAGRYYELLFPPPTGRSDPTQLFPDAAQSYSPPQLQNAYRWVQAIRGGAFSPTTYSATGTLEERGASWALMRWLGAQYGNGVYGRLVQTRLTGRANLEAATGRSFPSLYGDFAAAVFADSIVGTPRSAMPSRLTFGPDRNLRRIFARFNLTERATFPLLFPLQVDTLRVGGLVSGTMFPGGVQYAFLQAPSSGPAVQLRLQPLTGTSFPAGLQPQVTLLRLP